MHVSSVTTKGQVTIPAAIRRRFSLHQGGKVLFSVDGDTIVLRPVYESVEDAFGLVKPDKSVSLEEMDQAIRMRGSQ